MYDFIVNRDTYIFYLKTAKYCLFCGAMIVFVIARQFCCSLLFHDYFTIFRRCFISFLYRQFLSCLSDCTALPQCTILTAPFPRSAFLLDSRLYTAVSKVLAQYPVLSPPSVPAADCSLFSQCKRAGADAPALAACILSSREWIPCFSSGLFPGGFSLPVSCRGSSFSLRLSLQVLSVLFPAICSCICSGGQHLLSLPPARRRSQSCPCGRYRSRWTG